MKLPFKLPSVGIAGGLYLLITLIIIWPLVVSPATCTTTGGEEPLLSYLINWIAHTLQHQPNQLFEVPFFYPLSQTLTFSSPLITPSVLAIPWLKIVPVPLFALNVNVLLALWLTAWFSYLLAYEYTGHRYASFIGGMIAAFSVGRLDTIGHVQILALQWLPLGWWCGVKWLKTWKPGWLMGMWLAFIAQWLTDPFGGYGLAFIITVVVVIPLLYRRQWRRLGWLAATGGLALIPLILVYLPYFRSAAAYGSERTLQNVWGGSAYWLDYLYPTQSSRIRPVFDALFAKKPWPAYLGAGVSLMALAATLYWAKHRSRLKPEMWLPPLAIGWGSILLSFGPYFQIIRHGLQLPVPLPYWLAFHLIPGFKSMRTPQRWSQIAILGFALAGTMLLAKLYPKNKNGKRWVTAGLLAILLLEPALPIATTTLPDKSQIPLPYQLLMQVQDKVVLELPIQTWVMPLAHAEIRRLHYHSYLFGNRLRFVNGYSGYTPPQWEVMVKELQTFPHNAAWQRLADLQVDYILFNRNEWQLLAEKQFVAPAAEALASLNNNPELQVLYEDQEYVVVKLKREPI